MAIGWADEVHEAANRDETENRAGERGRTLDGEGLTTDEGPVEGDRTARLSGRFFGGRSHTYRLRVRRTGENAFEVQFGGDRKDGRVFVAVESTESGARVRTRETSTRERPLGLLLQRLASRYQRRVLARYGYRQVDSTRTLDARLR